MVINSLTNSKVKAWCKLKTKKYRDLEGLFLVEGEHLLKEALLKNAVTEIIATDAKFTNEDIPFYLVSEAIMQKISNQVSISKVVGVCKKLDEQPLKGNVCLLDNLQDPGNLGAIIRSALAFNIDTIIMSNDTVDLYNEKTIRASEGMIFHLNFWKKDLKEAITYLKKENYQIYGTNVREGKNLANINFSNKTAIIIGNEGQGMHEDLTKYCDELINIPISPKCESLNASIAASIIFYEIGGRL